LDRAQLAIGHPSNGLRFLDGFVRGFLFWLVGCFFRCGWFGIFDLLFDILDLLFDYFGFLCRLLRCFRLVVTGTTGESAGGEQGSCP
jgi:hypothetical protein